MEKTVCLCLMSLFDSLENDGCCVRLSYDLWLEKSIQDGTEYYDLYTDDGFIVACDGESYYKIEEDFNSIKLISDDSDKDFILSKKEFEFATMKVCI